MENDKAERLRLESKAEEERLRLVKFFDGVKVPVKHTNYYYLDYDKV